ncbi:hypothetical protein POP12_244 [Pectobacterium phage POP12]|nr:hypothetical protein POP12_244 [Pectobacterium phage POP12]
MKNVIRVTDQQIHSCFWNLLKRNKQDISETRIILDHDDEFLCIHIELNPSESKNWNNFIHQSEAVFINGYYYYGNWVGCKTKASYELMIRNWFANGYLF